MTARVPDRRIFALAIPALGALAAEPLYLLVDIAVVGHLGKESLAGLAVGAALLGNVIWLMSFLAYGTTGRAARLFGANRRAEAVDAGVQATWLGLGIGIVLLVISGIWMWWKRRPQGRLAAPPPVPGARLHIALGLIALAGVMLPLFGASLIAVFALDRMVAAVKPKVA